MNIFLSNAIFIDQKLEYHEMETFQVYARMIRQIHLPKDVSFYVFLISFEQDPITTSLCNVLNNSKKRQVVNNGQGSQKGFRAL